ncbi:MAG: thiamine pyrophosphate-dependent enzyme, partial [Tissierellia bacterium]|nr:thiamine pyrophosphate-dependent enzyme [Tissierellia bacterium]
MNEIKQEAINTVRLLSVDMIEKANSGHPGLPLGAAPMAFTLFHDIMKHNPKNSDWFDRDRFILSAGHGSAMLYSLLHLFEYGISMEDIKNFRQLGSKTAGHPEYGHAKGIEATTGPLGQGMAMAVGMAIAEANLAARFNKDDLEIVDHYTYALVGDGDMQEGITNEAASLAGALALEKLIVLYDSNNITIEGNTENSFSEDVRKRFEALHWDTFFVEDGNDIEAIRDAIAEAKKTDRPAFIEIKTKIGYGSVKEGSADSHGAPLGKENIPALKENLQWKYEEDFMVPEEVYQH